MHPSSQPDLPVQPPSDPVAGHAMGVSDDESKNDVESENFLSSDIQNSRAAASGRGRPRLTRAVLAGWQAVYQTAPRQLRRWVDAGEAHGEQCPLDTPAAMPAWWSRNMSHAVPVKILAAAKLANDSAPPITPGAAEITEDPPVPQQEPAAADQRNEPLDLSAFLLESGGEILQAARLVQAAYTQLEGAYRLGSRDVDYLQSRWQKAQEALRKAKIAEEEMRKRRRDWVSRVEINQDIAAAVELLRQMRSSMKRQVRELCPRIDPEILNVVLDAMDRVCAQQERVFRNLKSLKTPADVEHALAA